MTDFPRGWTYNAESNGGTASIEVAGAANVVHVLDTITARLFNQNELGYIAFQVGVYDGSTLLISPGILAQGTDNDEITLTGLDLAAGVGDELTVAFINATGINRTPWVYTDTALAGGSEASITLPAEAGVTHVLNSLDFKLYNTAGTGTAQYGADIYVNGGLVLSSALNAIAGSSDEWTINGSDLAVAPAGESLAAQFSGAPTTVNQVITIQGYDQQTSAPANYIQSLTIQGHDI